MKQITQQDRLEKFLIGFSEGLVDIHKKYWPDEQPVKLFTYRPWGNRYGRGWRFSFMITYSGADVHCWQDITLRSRDDLIRANQTMARLGYEFNARSPHLCYNDIVDKVRTKKKKLISWWGYSEQEYAELFPLEEGNTPWSELEALEPQDAEGFVYEEE